MTRKFVMLAIGVLLVALGIQVFICVNDAYAVCYPYPECLGLPPEPPTLPGVYDLTRPIHLDCEGGGSGGYYDEASIDFGPLINPAPGVRCKIRFYFEGCMSFDAACWMCVRFLRENQIVTQACPLAWWDCRVAEWTEFMDRTCGVNRVILYPCYDKDDCDYWAGGGYVAITKFELIYEPLHNQLKSSASELGFELGTNYPNPFNPETQISYDLPNDCWVKLSVYNIRGEKVKTLVEKFEAAGHKTVTWDGRNQEGDRVGSGVYFYRLETGEFTATKKMVLIR